MTTARMAGDVWFESHEEIIFFLRSVVVPTLHRLTARNTFRLNCTKQIYSCHGLKQN